MRFNSSTVSPALRWIAIASLLSTGCANALVSDQQPPSDAAGADAVVNGADGMGLSLAEARS
ncbi:MAG: hypothetical protein WCJ30_28065, partial [Deltaproteobacteria bacterium]